LGKSERKPEINLYAKAFNTVVEIAHSLGADLRRYYVDLHHWIHFNELRDQGKDFEYIMFRTEIHDIAAMHLLEGFRKCVHKYDNDKEKVRQCIEGKIDP